MKEHPILFSGPMIQAILAGRKTQTRRIVKPQPPLDTHRLIGPELYEPMAYDAFGDCYPGKEIYGVYDDYPGGEYGVKCPWQPGDRLWVREKWAKVNGVYLYAADEDATPLRWKPSIHMPRAASRITLEVVSVRVERLQDISEDDAKAEGAKPRFWYQPYGTKTEGEQRHVGRTPANNDVWRTGFAGIWEDINAKKGHGWDVNPWVWVIEFRRVTP